VVAEGDDLGEQTGQWNAERVGGGFDPGQVDDEPEIAMSVWASFAVDERRRDIAGGKPTLPYRVLSSHRRELARTDAVGNSGQISAREDVRVTRDCQLLIEDEVALELDFIGLLAVDPASNGVVKCEHRAGRLNRGGE
jgi:hypothetical protein